MPKPDEQLNREMMNEQASREIGFGLALAIAGLLLFPLLIFSIPFLVVMRIVNKPRIHLLLAIVGIVIFGFVMMYDFRSFFGLYDLVPAVDRLLENVFKMNNQLNAASYVAYASGGLFVSYILNVYMNYYRSKMVVSKEQKMEEFKDSAAFKKVYNYRFKLNEKVQRKWRSDIQSGKTDKLLCGISTAGKPYYMDFREINQHALVCATTGGGKTVFLLNLVEYALMKNYPFLFIDGKGSKESVDDVHKLCTDYGKDLKVFSDTNTFTYNPIKYGNSTVITDKLQHLVETESDYYVKVNETLVQTLIQFLDDFEIKRDLWSFAKYLDPAVIKGILNNDFEEVVEVEEAAAAVEKPTDEGYGSFLDEPEPVAEEKSEPATDYGSFLDMPEPEPEKPEEPKEKEEKPAEAVEKQPKRKRSERAEKYYERFFRRWEESSEGESYLFENASTVRMAIYSILDSELGHLFEEKPDGLDLIEISDQKQALFISLDGLIYDKYIKQIARFIISDVNYLVSYRNRNKKIDEPFLAIYDEFSVYANDKIVDTINKSRSGGFHCVIATQTLADLEKVDKTLVGQVVGNTNTYVIGQTNNPNEVEAWANTLGTYKDVDTTIVTERKQGRLKRLDLTGDKGTIRQVQKYKIPPDAIRAIKTGQFIFSRKASKEIVEPEIVYVRHPLH